MAKDTLKGLGATNHTADGYERSARDYYGTDPRSTKAILERVKFNHHIWEPCSGHGLMVNVLRDAGYNVLATDIYDYGCQDKIMDFLSAENNKVFDGDIVTNPPYNLAAECISKAIECVKPGAKVAAYLKTLFLEGQSRYDKLFKENPPKYVYIFSGRQVCSKVDDFTVGSAVSYSWFIWEKGFIGDPVIKWIR